MKKTTSFSVTSVTSVTILLFIVINSSFLVEINAQANGVNELNQVQASLNANGFTVMQSLLENSTIVEALNFTNGENKTLFAPTDEAFANVNASLLQNVTFVTQLLAYHIVPLYLPSSILIATLIVGNNATNFPTQLGENYLVALAQNSMGNISINGNYLNRSDMVENKVTSLHGINAILTLPTSPNAGTVEEMTAVELLNMTGEHSTILTLLGNSNVSSGINLTDGSPKTIFAPTDAAFAALPSSVQSQLSNTDLLVSILSYHIIPSYLPVSVVLSSLNSSNNSLSLPTLLGTNETVNVTLNGTSVLVNGISVNETNIAATERTAIHSINGVLIPSSLSVQVASEIELDSVLSSLNSSGYTTFASLLENSNISSALNLSNGQPKTIFAPSNAAIAALNLSSSDLKNTTLIVDVLSYHIVPLYLPSTVILSTLESSNNATNVTTLLGEDYTINVTRNGTGIFVNSILVNQTDISKTGKTAVHGISGVLVPPSDVVSLPPSSSSPPPSSSSSSPPPSPPPSMAVRIPRFYAAVVPLFAVFMTSFGILMS